LQSLARSSPPFKNEKFLVLLGSELRTEIAEACLEMADKCGEPPLDEQD
jgi:hypothetical protein